MKIYVNRLPPEGAVLEEEISASGWELESENLRFSTPLKIKAEVSKVTNALIVKLHLEARLNMVCSRCLQVFDSGFKKNLQLEYVIDKNIQVIDLDPDIRQEIILDYPIKPLCSLACLGLCLGCGKNLNQGPCNCDMS